MHLLCCAPATTSSSTYTDISHFKLLRLIGSGANARVRIVERRSTAAIYALKYFDKSKCAKHPASAAGLIQERSLLQQLSHPFLVNMYFAFQDDINCYFVLDLMLGGDLKYHRLHRGSLGENSVRFYVAEISSALAYLHKLGICHRDVKPENILLDLQGHAHLTDFNAAIRLSSHDNSLAGTIAYMAPEMLARTGYSYHVDYWALGVTAYECLFFGARPFGHPSRDPARVTDAILTDDLVFPPDAPRICSPDGCAALAALLERDPTKRLGCKPRARKPLLREHPWFRTIDWARLDARQLPPPFQPDSRAWNFDDVPAPPLLARTVNRLSHMSDKLAPDSPAQRLLEERFTPFDCERMPRTKPKAD